MKKPAAQRPTKPEQVSSGVEIPQSNNHPKSSWLPPTALGYVLPVAAVVFLVINVILFAHLRTKTAAPAAVPVPTPSPKPSPTPTPTPTPYPLPQGKRSFELSFGKNTKGPRINKVTVDPFDPKMEQEQTYTIEVKHDQPVITADLALHTDHKIATYSLKRVSGTDIDGTWQVKITTNDSHLYEYYAYFIIKSAVDEFRGGLTFRAY